MRSFRLIVNSPTGEQKIEKVSETGRYFDPSLVVWDERTDGALPDDIELGKMMRKGKSLVKSADFLPDHQAILDGETAKSQIRQNYSTLREELLADAEIAQIISMVKNGNKQGVSDHFAAKLPTELHESLSKMAMILATMNEETTNE